MRYIIECVYTREELQEHIVILRTIVIFYEARNDDDNRITSVNPFDQANSHVISKVGANGNYRMIDLHEMPVKEAKEEVLNQLKLAKEEKRMCQLN